MHISYYDNADDACHQISYEARLGGYGWGILGQKWEKGAIEKIFFGKVPLWSKTFLLTL